MNLRSFFLVLLVLQSSVVTKLSAHEENQQTIIVVQESEALIEASALNIAGHWGLSSCLYLFLAELLRTRGAAYAEYASTQEKTLVADYNTAMQDPQSKNPMAADYLRERFKCQYASNLLDQWCSFSIRGLAAGAYFLSFIAFIKHLKNKKYQNNNKFIIKLF